MSSTLAHAPSARVLVVDDDLANRESLSRRLARRGYVADTAEDGPSALAAVDAGDYDLVLLDVMMPGMSGLEVLTKLRETRSPVDLPIIMATARDAAENVVEALGLGANDYVTKPLDFPVVLARVATQVELRRSVRAVQVLQEDLARRNAELEAAAERQQRELQMAAAIQQTFLPQRNPASDELDLEWRFVPCEGLAGDGLNALRLDADHVALYVFDVSGHGTAAALTAVAASRMLAPAHDPASLLVDRAAASADDAAKPIVSPAEVIAQLDARFPFTFQTNQFLTIAYGVLHLPTGRLTFASAGHPPTLHVKPDGSVERLESGGPPVGIGERCEEQTVMLELGSRLYLYSDGVAESASPEKELFGTDRLAELLADRRDGTLSDSLEAVQARLLQWRGGRPANDDVSLLAVQLR